MPNDVRWIRITTDMFNDEKIKIIESMPDADALIVLWVKLICQAGKVNDGGWVYLAKELPYTIEELAMVLDRPVNTVRLALDTFKRLRMIDWTEEGVFLVNWEMHQNVQGLEKIRENTRRRVAAHRQRQKVKLLSNENSENNNSNEYVTLRNVTVTGAEKRREEYIREEKESFNIWNNVLETLKGNVTTTNFKTWLSGSVGVEINENEFIVGVENEFKARYLEQNMRGLIEKAIVQQCGKELKTQFVLFER